MNMDILRLRLDVTPDPLAAFSALAGNGRTAGMAMLESMATGHAGTQRSLLALRAALRISLQQQTVAVDALNANGRAALSRLEQKTGAKRLDENRVVFDVSPANQESRDENTRLREPSVLDPLRDVLDAFKPARKNDRDRVLLIGALTFELAERFETLPALPPDELPDYVFLLPDVLLDIDHLKGRAELSAVAFDTPSGNDLARTLRDMAGKLAKLSQAQGFDAPSTNDATLACDDEEFGRLVEAGRKAVIEGEVFQVVLSRHWELPCPDPLAAYARLRASNPSPYLFFLNDDSAILFGASPESALRFDAGTRELDVYPVAGTRPRGRNSDEDARLEAELRLNAKEVAEHMMLVDLARNDVARVCEPGTRKVPVLLGVDRYAHVMHLVSRVAGKLRADLDALHALRACLNVGTLSGAPKLRASELIRDMESERRGFYGGAVGFLDAAGNLDMAITIRSATVRNGTARVQTGAGIVLDSMPQAEADETRNKARAVLRAIGVGKEASA